ncbi:MAG: hypothetical protein WC340_05400 [Kiritimatiellia bacterium]
MNNETSNQSEMQNNSHEEQITRTYRPRLSFYHANNKGSGSAAQFELVPACGDRDGVIYLTLAQQKSVATGSVEQGNRQYATFDWQNRVTVKLNFSDICQMLQVFRGAATTIAEGKGLYHSSHNTTTIINLTRQADPYPGLALEVSRRNKSESEAPNRVRIMLNSAEAFGVGAVLEQSLGVIAFGIPKEPFSEFTPPRPEG